MRIFQNYINVYYYLNNERWVIVISNECALYMLKFPIKNQVDQETSMYPDSVKIYYYWQW